MSSIDPFSPLPFSPNKGDMLSPETEISTLTISTLALEALRTRNKAAANKIYLTLFKELQRSPLSNEFRSIFGSIVSSPETNETIDQLRFICQVNANKFKPLGSEKGLPRKIWGARA